MITKQKLLKLKNKAIEDLGGVGLQNWNELIDVDNLRELGMIKLAYLSCGVDITMAEAYMLWEDFSRTCGLPWFRRYKFPYLVNRLSCEQCIACTLYDYKPLANSTLSNYSTKLSFRLLSKKEIKKLGIKLIDFAINKDPERYNFTIVGNLLGDCFMGKIEVADGIYVTEQDLEEYDD